MQALTRQETILALQQRYDTSRCERLQENFKNDFMNSTLFSTALWSLIAMGNGGLLYAFLCYYLWN